MENVCINNLKTLTIDETSNDLMKFVDLFTLNHENFFDFKVCVENGTYLLKKGEVPVFNFRTFDSLNITDFDRDTLKTNKRKEFSFTRTIKNLFSLDIANSVLIICWSKERSYYAVIESRNEIYDYGLNLIMDEEIYFKVFDVKKVSKTSKSDVYFIIRMLNKLDQNDYLLNALICSDLFIKELKSKTGINTLYTSYVLNLNNFAIIGDELDCMFFQAIDFYNSKRKLYDTIDNFTLNGKELNDGITYDFDNKAYRLEEYSFNLLSDYIKERKLKRILLSDKRYFGCQENSIKLAFLLKYHNIDDVFVVGGKRKANDVDYLFHSWVEVDNYVLDFNSNLVMEKSQYYELYNAIDINRERIENIDECIELAETFYGLQLHPILYNYFSSFLQTDLKKNQHLLRNTKEDI